MLRAIGQSELLNEVLLDATSACHEGLLTDEEKASAATTDDSVRVKIVAEMYTRQVSRDKSTTTECFDGKSEATTPPPGWLGRVWQLMYWPLAATKEKDHQRRQRLLQQRRDVRGGMECDCTSTPVTDHHCPCKDEAL